MNLQITGLKVDAGTGPGSRGGHVVGKTKSGKPIYSAFGHAGHGKFSMSDHIEAANIHHGLSKEAARSGDTPGYSRHQGHDEKHRNKANKMEKEGHTLGGK